MAKKAIKIGLDFDGVVAYNPFRVIRAPVKWLKRDLLGIKKLTFFVPKNDLQRFLWSLVHESSIFPADGIELLKQLSTNKNYEFHLVTARFGFLKNNLYEWLQRNKLLGVFKSININDGQEQPHIYKLEKLKKLKLDYFVEDNLDIVSYVHGKTATKVFWIYNFMDKGYRYPYKFDKLKGALEEICK